MHIAQLQIDHWLGPLVWGRVSDLGPEGLGFASQLVLAETINLSLFLRLCETLHTKRRGGGLEWPISV